MLPNLEEIRRFADSQIPEHAVRPGRFPLSINLRFHDPPAEGRASRASRAVKRAESRIQNRRMASTADHFNPESQNPTFQSPRSKAAAHFTLRESRIQNPATKSMASSVSVKIQSTESRSVPWGVSGEGVFRVNPESQDPQNTLHARGLTL